MTFGLPVDGPRIVPFGEARLTTDKLPNGRLAFRVTQRFDDPDSFHSDGRLHAALDVGNFSCGDRVLAMDVGWAFAGTDSAGGRYVIIDHGDGRVTRYWHLDDWTIPVGQRIQVGKGQQIGIVGRTGLGNVCHLHLEYAVNGRKLDLWPLLGGSLPDTSTEDPMPVLTRRITDQQFRVPAGTDFRKAPTFGSAPYYRSPGSMSVQPFGTVDGDAYKVSATQTSKEWLVYVASDLTYGYVPAVNGELTPIDVKDDCAPEVQAATDPLRARIDNLKAISADSNKRIQNG